jgi:hypothetical protein
MTRTITRSLLVFSLSLISTTWLLAQTPSADRFLDGMAARPARDEVEQNQAGEISQTLTIASLRSRKGNSSRSDASAQWQ